MDSCLSLDRSIIPEGWVKTDFEGSDLVSDSYELYTWGEEYEWRIF